MNERAVCDVCFRHCAIPEGGSGFCGARICRNGTITASNYGRLTSLALDPIEKKPIARFFPGSRILSVGSYGCNLACPFCQNYEISMARATDSASGRVHMGTTRADRRKQRLSTRNVLPDELAELAEAYREYGNIGVAFTYNEPLIGWEYVRDVAMEIKKRGMKTVLVSNGCASERVMKEILPYIDAMNIDLKGFTPEFYRDFAGGDLGMVKAFISGAVKGCHMELTTLIIPGKNDAEEEMRREAAWIASLDSGKGEIPLHVTRYFPRYRCRIPATPVSAVYRLADAAREYLRYVYVGNC